MSLSIDQTRKLVADELPSAIPNNIGAVNMRTAVLATIDLFGTGSFANLAYDNVEIYDKDTNPYAEQLERLWKAQLDDFSGIAPPTDPDVTSNFNWIEVSQAGGSAIVEHQVGAYGEGLQVVLGTVDGNRVLVELLNPSRPFESANLQTEFDGGDWGIVGEPPGAGSGVTPAQLQDNIHLYDEDSGGANAYSVVPVPAYTGHVDGMVFYFKATNANTGASTLDDGLDTVPIVRRNGTPTKADDIPAGSMNQVVRDGAQWQLMNSGNIGDVIPFIYTVTVGALETISLPMAVGNDSLYSFNVDFGDETGEKTVNAYADVDREHTYTLAGTYDITIPSGIFDYIKFADSPNSIVGLKSFGMAGVGSQSFINCSNFDTMSATDIPSIYLNTLNECFRDAPISSVDAAINNWDVSTVTNMSMMFRGTSFNQNIDSWNVGLVQNMSFMFLGNSSYNQSMNSWDVGSVTNMSGMFQSSSVFNGAISSWNVSAVTNMSSMFRDNGFNQDITSWVTTALTNMSFMFFDNTAFNQDISGWNVSIVTNMNSTFTLAIAFNQDISSWNVGAVTNMANMFQNATVFDQDLSSWDVTSLSTASNMFLNITLSTANYDAMIDINTGWPSQAVQSSVSFHAGNSTYTQTAVDSGNTDATTTNKLVDSTQNFLTTVTANDIAHNTSDATFAKATAVDSDTTLSVSNDVFPTGKAYVIQSSNAAKGRFKLVDTHSWTITDGGAV